MRNSVEPSASAREAATEAAALRATAVELCSEASNVREELERAFGAMAEILPALSQDGELLTGHLEKLFDAGRTDTVAGTLERTASVAARFSSAIGLMNSRDREVVRRADVVAEGAAKMADLLAGVDRLAHGLRRTGLNASAMAAKLGAEGAAFGRLTEGLTSLAGRAMHDADCIRSACKTLRSQAEAIVAMEARETGQMERLAVDAGAVEYAAGNATGRLGDLGVSLRAAAGHTRSAQSAIHDIMIAIQREDIIRQKVQHLEMAFEEMAKSGAIQSDKGAPSDEGLAVVVQLATLAASLIADVRTDLQELIQIVAPPLAKLSEAAGAVAGVRHASCLDADCGSLLRGPLRIIAEAAERVSGTQADESRDREVAASVGQAVAQLARALPELVDEGRQLVAIHFQIRIEVARSQALRAASTISEELADTYERLHELVRVAESSLTGIESALQPMDLALAAQRAERESLRTAAGELATTGGAVQPCAQTFADALGEAFALGERVRGATDRFELALSSLRQELERQDERARRATAVGTAAARELERRHGKGWALRFGAAASAQLEELAARFTVFAHSAAARQIADSEGGSGAQPGELVVF